MSYAKGTSVSVAKTKGEIEDLLGRYGCDKFIAGTEGARAMLGFRIPGGEGHPLQVRITLELPDPDDDAYWMTPAKGKMRSADAARAAWEQACRSKWRALYLVMKAKLVAVDEGISTIEREFLPDVVTEDGTTVERRIAGAQPLGLALAGGGGVPLLGSS
ncbi:MAG: hypothetical protein ACIAQU_02340 [Phycisphaerales bacterium JB064]